MIDYMIYVRLIIGIGLLLAGGVSVMLDHSPTQILFSTLAIAVGIMFIVLGLRPEEVNKIEKEIEGIDKIEEFDHLLDEEYSKEKEGAEYSNQIGKGGRK